VRRTREGSNHGVRQTVFEERVPPTARAHRRAPGPRYGKAGARRTRGPLGLAAFALTTFVLSMFNGRPGQQSRGAGLCSDWRWPYGGIAQILAGMWEFPHRKHVRRCRLHIVWRVLDLVLGLCHLFRGLGAGRTRGPAQSASIWSPGASSRSTCSSPRCGRRPAIRDGIRLAGGDVSSCSGSATRTKAPAWSKSAAGSALATAVAAWYASFAAVTNSTFGRIVLAGPPRSATDRRKPGNGQRRNSLSKPRAGAECAAGGRAFSDPPSQFREDAPALGPGHLRAGRGPTRRPWWMRQATELLDWIEEPTKGPRRFQPRRSMSGSPTAS